MPQFWGKVVLLFRSIIIFVSRNDQKNIPFVQRSYWYKRCNLIKILVAAQNSSPLFGRNILIPMIFLRCEKKFIQQEAFSLAALLQSCSFLFLNTLFPLAFPLFSNVQRWPPTKETILVSSFIGKKTRSGKYARNFFQCITPFNVLSRRIIVALDKLETNMPSCYYRVSVVYYWTFLPFVFVVMKNVPVLRRATAVGKKLGKSSYTMSTE